MINETEFNALISLLDDPDTEVFDHVVGKLKSFGPDIIPSLETVWESSFDPDLQQRIELLIHTIHFDNLREALAEWAQKPEDLLEGVLLLCKYQYPDLDEKKVKRQLDKLKRSIWLELNFNLTPIEQINVFNQIFYKTYGFSGNTANMQDPQNAYLNVVLDSKKGNTLSLGIIYLILAQDLGMPVYGVSLPQHFILVYMKEQLQSMGPGQDLRNEVLFYINTFNKGMIFTRNEINMFLKKLKLDPKDEFYLPCEPPAIVRELLNSLINSFEELGSKDKVEELKELLRSLD